jgi:hypothetical protein
LGNESHDTHGQLVSGRHIGGDKVNPGFLKAQQEVSIA